MQHHECMYAARQPAIHPASRRYINHLSKNCGSCLRNLTCDTGLMMFLTARTTDRSLSTQVACVLDVHTGGAAAISTNGSCSCKGWV